MVSCRSCVADHLARVVVFALAATPFAFGADWYVDAAASNCATATGGVSDPFCQIADALAVAVDGDTIHVAAGTYPENLIVVQDVTLLGTSGAATTVVDGGGNGSVVDLSGAAVTIDGFTLRNGAATSGAGILIGSDASLVLAHSVVEDNIAARSGGGVMNDGGTLVVTDSEIRSNRSGTLTDGSLGDGGGVCNDGGAVALVRTTLDDNAAGDDLTANYANGRGGSIYSQNGTLSLEECTVTSSFARDEGGGVRSDNSTLTITRSEIRQCRSRAGGGLYAYPGDATVEQSTIAENQAVTIANEGGGAGGVAMGGRAMLMIDCRISDNVASRTAGGFSGSASMVRCIVSGNTASEYGGGLWIGEFTAEDCEFVENQVVGDLVQGGGGIFWSAGMASILHSTVARNRCVDLSGNPTGTGGGVYAPDAVFGTWLEFGHCIFAENVAATLSDIDGLFTVGFNCLGQGAGTDGTDRYGIDPQFVDSANGDFSLLPTSPCIDTGDPSLVAAGMDLAWNPRLLDGDADRTMIVDVGAHEFSRTHLEVSGSATPGGTLTFTSSGEAGLRLFLFIGLARSELLLPRYGALFIDVTSTWILLPWGTIPNTIDVDVDPTLPVPLAVELQQLALDASTHSGNFGNLVPLLIE